MRFTSAELQLGITTELRAAWSRDGGDIGDEQLVVAAKRAYEHLSSAHDWYANHRVEDVTVVRSGD